MDREGIQENEKFVKSTDVKVLCGSKYYWTSVTKGNEAGKQEIMDRLGCMRLALILWKGCRN